MLDKAKILAEIRKYKDNAECYLKVHPEDKAFEQQRLVIMELLSFINSLEEPVNEKQMYKAGYIDGFEDGVRDSMEKEEEPVNKSAWLTELQEKLDNATPEQFQELWDKYHDDEEPVSEDMEATACDCDFNEEAREAFIEGYKLGKQDSINKSVEWLKENLTNNPSGRIGAANYGVVTKGILINEFRKAMED